MVMDGMEMIEPILTSTASNEDSLTQAKKTTRPEKIWSLIKTLAVCFVVVSLVIIFVMYFQEKKKTGSIVAAIESIQSLNQTFHRAVNVSSGHATLTDEKMNELAQAIDNIFDMMDNKQEVIDELEAMVTRLNLTFDARNSVIQDLNKVIEGLGTAWCKYHSGIEFNGTCLWEEDEPENMTLIYAYRKCNEIAPSKLPDIHSEEEYLQVMKYLRSKIPSGKTYINTWTGMTREHWTHRAMLSNGKPAPFIKTLPSPSKQWSLAGPTRTNIYLHVRKDAADSFQGMGALSPSTTYTTVKTILCQRTSFTDALMLTTDEEVWCQSRGGIAYHGTCVWADEAPSNMNLTNALATCNESAPSKLPEVYGGQEYIEIMEYLRTKISKGNTYIIAWTGMKRNQTTGQAMLSNGLPAPYTKPRTKSGRWADATETNVNVYLIAGVDTSLSDEGMASISPSYEFQNDKKIVLCQKL